MKHIRKWKNMTITLGVMLAFMAGITLVHALDDGAYLVGRTTSYADPSTGEPIDGGSDVALGDSMCNSIVEPQILVEQTNGKTYITMGLGLASNTSNVRIQVNGKKVALTKTGTSTRNDDAVNHYRFEVNSLQDKISPIMYVDPMGRDVQFFVQLDASSAVAGTGVYQSKMVPASTKKDTPAQQDENKKNQVQEQKTNTNTNKEQQTDDTTKEEKKEQKEIENNKDDVNYDPLDGVKGLSKHMITDTEKTDPTAVIAIGTGVLIAAIGGLGYWIWKKGKKA